MRCTVHTRGKHGRESCTGELVLSRGASPGRASIDDRAGDGTIDGTPESLAQLFDQAEAVTGCQASSGA